MGQKPQNSKGQGMANEPTISLVGRLGNDPEVGFSSSGRAVVNLSVAVTPRVKDQNDKWIDKDTLWFRVNLWKNAEAAADELTKGDYVAVTGRFSNPSYTAKDGATKSALEINADYVAIIPTQKTHGQSEEAPW
jgi:single-strand DNA-binding protein